MLSYDPDGMSVQDFVDYWQGYIFVFNEQDSEWLAVSLRDSKLLIAEHFEIDLHSDGYCEVCHAGDEDMEHDCEDYWISPVRDLPYETAYQMLGEAFLHKPNLRVSRSTTINPLTMWDDPGVLTHSPRGGYIRMPGRNAPVYLRKRAPRSRNRGVQVNTYSAMPPMPGLEFGHSWDGLPSIIGYASLVEALRDRWEGDVFSVLLDETTAAVLVPDEQNREAWGDPELRKHLLMEQEQVGHPIDYPMWPWSPILGNAISSAAGRRSNPTTAEPRAVSVGLCARMNVGWPVYTPGNRGSVPRRDPTVITECSRLLKEQRMVLLVEGTLPTGRARELYERQIHNAAHAARRSDDD